MADMGSFEWISINTPQTPTTYLSLDIKTAEMEQYIYAALVDDAVAYVKDLSLTCHRNDRSDKVLISCWWIPAWRHKAISGNVSIEVTSTGPLTRKPTIARAQRVMKWQKHYAEGHSHRALRGIYPQLG
ncbi:hypothetical protein PI124_g18198 [Phytophthora idaei]|nr:hypothetical protein PI125_g18857 [Phytophthora idaei]KAG3137005.1 hypothetical protein PI126_g17570 [Phytophthora idaei]KAG3236792.1 hypothetical protein PI124_g18198 [Phytophthora idaei]